MFEITGRRVLYAVAGLIGLILVIILLTRSGGHKNQLPDTGNPQAQTAQTQSAQTGAFDPNKVPYGGNTLNNRPLKRALDKPAFDPNMFASIESGEITEADTGTLEQPTELGKEIFDPKEVKFFPLWEYKDKPNVAKSFYDMAPDVDVDEQAVTSILNEINLGIPFEVEVYDQRNDPTGTLMWHPKDGSLLKTQVGYYFGYGAAWWDFQKDPAGPPVYDHPVGAWVNLMAHFGSTPEEVLKNANSDLINALAQIAETSKKMSASDFKSKYGNRQLVVSGYK